MGGGADPVSLDRLPALDSPLQIRSGQVRYFKWGAASLAERLD